MFANRHTRLLNKALRCMAASRHPFVVRVTDGLRVAGQVPHCPLEQRPALVLLLLDAVAADRTDLMGDADADAQRSTASSPFLLNSPA